MLSFLLIAAEEVTEQQGGSVFDWRVLLPFGVVFVMLLLMPKLLRRNREERRRLEKQITRETENRLNVKSEADRVMVEIMEIGREINARLDNKIRLLNKLIKDADDLVVRLEKIENKRALPDDEEPVTVHAVEDDSGAEEVMAKPESRPNPATDTTVELRQKPGDKTFLYSPRNLKAAQKNVREDESQAEAEENRTGSGRWKADVRKRIAQLSEEGRDAAEIARLTRMSVAEVSLMLELIRRDG